MNWIEALSSLKSDAQSYVLLTVMNTRGSSPRDVGTKMVVSHDKTYDTIGGGALEYQAIKIARQLLEYNQIESNPTLQHTESFNLGQDLKQCCGGVVSVFFEVFPATNFIVNIFGAGHIGQALLKILGDIDCQVNLFDSREEFLFDKDADQIQCIHLTEPELAVETCAAKSCYLVMTHDHALDQQLIEAILARKDSFYCGLIGSRTKGLKFRQRLLKKGYSQDELLNLTCPTGLETIKTKKPMEIAVSIVAELLVLRESQQLSMAGPNSDQQKVIPLKGRE